MPEVGSKDEARAARRTRGPGGSVGPDDLLSLLASASPPLLQGLNPPAFLRFVAACRTQRVAQARMILSQGEHACMAYLILRGSVEVSFIDNDGNRVLAHLARPGEVVGEVEILSGHPCAATCIALPDTVLAAFDVGLLKRSLPAETLLHNLARIFHARLVRDNRQHTAAMFFSSEDRIRIHLLSLTTPEHPCARISQADLATFCGCSRQTVNRTLAQLRALGIVDLGRGQIVVRDRPKLEAARLSAPQADAAAR